jgi:hypothetical protein
MEFLIIATIIGLVFFPRVTLTCVLFHYGHIALATFFCVLLVIKYFIQKSN